MGVEVAIAILVAGLVIAGIFGAVAADDANKFARLGDITGMEKARIIGEVGPPNSISASPEGTLLQWIETSAYGGYHYAILFDFKDKAIGYTHQFNA